MGLSVVHSERPKCINTFGASGSGIALVPLKVKVTLANVVCSNIPTSRKLEVVRKSSFRQMA